MGHFDRDEQQTERKIEITQRLRKETTVTVKWIADRLHMGSVISVNNRLHLTRNGRLGR